MDSLKKSREIGQFFEALVFLNLKVLAECMVPKGRLYYWRTVTGKEVDFVLEQGKNLYAFEVKLSKKPLLNDAKNLIEFTGHFPETKMTFLVHAGGTIRYLHSKVLAVPWWWIFR